MRARLAIDGSLPHARTDAAVLVGLSGGLDSTALLHALASDSSIRARGLRALHVNHGLHPDAQRWEAHCAELCRTLDVPFSATRVVVRRDGRGPEAAARHARHVALREAAGPGDVVALAHHLDDQAETFLLRALRASGPDGLGAMEPWRAFGAAWLWRPMLHLPRATIADYARAHGLAWLEDPSNADAGLDRNFLRLHVLPQLRERWPHASGALAGAAARCSASARLLVQDDSAALHALRTGADTIDAERLRALPAERRARVLRAWVSTLGLPPLPARGVQQVEAALLGARADAQAEFAWSGARIRRWRTWLWAGDVAPPLPAGWQVEWDGSRPLDLPDGGQLRLEGAASFVTPLTVRARRGGERIRLPGRTHRHVLKHVLQDLAVPPWEREHLPVLCAMDGDVEAAGDVVVGAGLAGWLSGSHASLCWSRPPALRGR